MSCQKHFLFYAVVDAVRYGTSTIPHRIRTLDSIEHVKIAALANRWRDKFFNGGNMNFAVLLGWESSVAPFHTNHHLQHSRNCVIIYLCSFRFTRFNNGVTVSNVSGVLLPSIHSLARRRSEERCI